MERATAPRSYSYKTAIILGAIPGLAYGLSTQFINSVFSPSVPYSHYPLGIVGNCAASALGLALICLVCSLPGDPYRGALLGGIWLVLVLELRVVLLGMPLIAVLLGSLASIFALMGLLIEIVLSIPVMLVLCWTLDIQAELFYKPVWSWPRVRPPLGFVVGALALGFFSLYPADVRAAMVNTTRLIDQGLVASTPDDLPAPLKSQGDAAGFPASARSPYTLELGKQARLAQDFPAPLQRYLIVIVARFRSGWTLACLYLNSLDAPHCKRFSRLHAPPSTDLRTGQTQTQV